MLYFHNIFQFQVSEEILVNQSSNPSHITCMMKYLLGSESSVKTVKFCHIIDKMTIMSRSPISLNKITKTIDDKSALVFISY